MNLVFNRFPRATRRAGASHPIGLSQRRAWFEGEDVGDNPAIPDWIKDPAKAYAEIEKLRKENAEHRTKNVDLEKRLSAIESSTKVADEKKLVEQQEWQKLAEKRAADASAAEQRAAAAELRALRIEVALEAGIPAKLAGRLQGSTREELLADATGLKGELKLEEPAQALPPNPANPAQRPAQTTTANPGGKPVVKTEKEMATEYLGGGSRDHLAAGSQPTQTDGSTHWTFGA